MNRTTNENPYYYKVRSRVNLRKAWSKVYQNGIRSKSDFTRKAVSEFSIKSEQYLEQIYRKLLQKKWKFDPAEGVLKKRPGKFPRPIVVASIRNRIVQRSILEVLQNESSLEKYYKTDTSFGGITHRSVRQAIERAYKTIMAGKAKYYIQSDIKDFFTKIPRKHVISIIKQQINDTEFLKLFSKATDTELINLDKLLRYKDIFPIYEIGVAQGCCLSPMIGNILLYEFDKKINSNGVLCLRYIDDFIIFANDQKSLSSSFRKAKIILKKLGLTAYDPSEKNSKAKAGKTEKGFEYLGCKIIPGLISPNKNSRKRLLYKVDEIIHCSVSAMVNPQKMYNNNLSLIDTLYSLSNLLSGWGNQYSYCNDRQLFKELDLKINDRLSHYFRQYYGKRKIYKDNQDYQNVRRLLGVHLLEGSKFKPIT